MQSSPSPNILGITPIFVFVALIISAGVATSDITAMPVLVGFMLAAGYALLLQPKDKQLSITEKVQLFCQGGGNSNIILLVIIFLMAGAFYSLTIDIGARDATVNLALTWVPQSLILPGLFVICCFISFAMGTSMGTITALSPIGVGLAESLGLSVPLLLGVVISGAMFGDNLSFVSDTTIAATRSQNVKLTDKFKANLLVVLPAAILTAIVLFSLDVGHPPQLEEKSYDLINVLPFVIIVGCALIGMNVVLVLASGIGSAAAVGLLNGSLDTLGLFASIQTGMDWMQNLALIAITIGGIVALMSAYGGISWLIRLLTRRVRSKRGAELSIASLVSFLDLTTANNTIAIVTAGPIAKDLGGEYDADPRRIASLLDIFSCACQGLVPYSPQLLTAAAIGGISPLSLTLYCWYPMMLMVFGLLSVATGWPKFNQPVEASL
ncbi:Na+/H+ antiporter NhaC family protein [Salinimonas chungwhensis]|uniref:Na+/H+ antiporter NhaC family protein n=1 Tax=Salinimonas chungwhensis TaxID=265425 RepID=UPI00035F9C79|nr:Na+/H+ antiporter NhaC family protein [Salinimonas chungwhensis]